MERIKNFVKSKGFIPIDVSSQINDFGKYMNFIQKLSDSKYDKCLFIIDTELLNDLMYHMYKETLLNNDNHAYVISNRKNSRVLFKGHHIENYKLGNIEEFLTDYDRNCIVCFEEYSRMRGCGICHKFICEKCIDKLYKNCFNECPHCRTVF